MSSFNMSDCADPIDISGSRDASAAIIDVINNMPLFHLENSSNLEILTWQRAHLQLSSSPHVQNKQNMTQ